MIKKLLTIAMLFFAIKGKAQTNWTQVFGKQRFVQGLGLPVRDTTNTYPVDSAQIVLRPQDSTIYWRYKGYWVKVGAVDTASLSSRINARVKYSDTAAMLSPYYRKADTANKWVNAITSVSDTLLAVAKGSSTTTLRYVKGSGTNSQYIRGDGTYANFPTVGGGGGQVYYFNGNTYQQKINGDSLFQMSTSVGGGAGRIFARNGTGLIASFITDSLKPNQTELPAGVWLFNLYLQESTSSSNHAIIMTKISKWNGTTLTVIDSSQNEEVSNGSVKDLYSIAISLNTAYSLSATDRIVIQVYIKSNPNNKTISLYTEDNNLASVTTTFSSGLSSLNGLTSTTQSFAIGTSGSDFGVTSTGATHTFNLPTASSVNRGALSTSDWSVFNSKIGAGDTAAMLARATLRYVTDKGNTTNRAISYAGTDFSGLTNMTSSSTILVNNYNEINFSDDILAALSDIDNGFQTRAYLYDGGGLLLAEGYVDNYISDGSGGTIVTYYIDAVNGTPDVNSVVKFVVRRYFDNDYLTVKEGGRQSKLKTVEVLNDYGITTTAINNYFYGVDAGGNNTGNYVIGLGNLAANENTGGDVTAIGNLAAYNNTGDYVTAIGNLAAYNNTGDYVIGIGNLAAYNNTGDNVVGIGNQAANGNTGNLVTAIGYQAAYNNTGVNVVSIGYQAAINNIYNYVNLIGKEVQAPEENTTTFSTTGSDKLSFKHAIVLDSNGLPYLKIIFESTEYFIPLLSTLP